MYMMYIYIYIFLWIDILSLGLSFQIYPIKTTAEKISLEATPQSLAQKRPVKLALFGKDESKQNRQVSIEKWRKIEEKNLVKMKSIILAFRVFEILGPLGGLVANYSRQW